MIRYSDKDDLSGIIALWNEAFGDTEKEIRFFLDNCYNPLNTLIYEIDGEIASMLFLLEGDMHFRESDYASYYLYAACTLKKFRGRGLMAELLKFANKTAGSRGKHFICLRPGEKSLFEYYKKYGYQTVFTVKESKFSLSETAYEPEELTKCKTDVTSLRNDAFKGHNYFKWDKQFVDFAFLHNKYFGGRDFTNCKGYVIYSVISDKIVVKETTFTSVSNIVGYVKDSSFNYARNIDILFPSWIDIRGSIVPYAMMIAVSDEGQRIINLIDNAYLGLTLE